VILAQMGCLVPAAFYSSGCMDRIFTHFGTGDSVETNSSTFMVEMQVFKFQGTPPPPGGRTNFPLHGEDAAPCLLSTPHPRFSKVVFNQPPRHNNSSDR